LLTALAAAAEQHDQCLTVLREVLPVTRPQSMTDSPIPSNHLTLEVLPCSRRNLAVVTFAAACGSRLSDHGV
jgi:hypothetical protein